MGTLTTTIGGTSVSILTGSLQIPRVLGSRSVASFVVNDATHAFHMTSGMPVTISDSVYGLLYAGFVDTPTENNLDPTAFNQVAVTCADTRRLADKRRVTVDYTGRTAGDIATDFLSRYLAAEGVTAAYAQRYDSTAATFGAGTLTGTTAAAGDLELAAAGTIFSKTETTTADFNTGTRTNVTGVNNSLQLTSTKALRLTGSANSPLGTNLYTYNKFWGGTRAVASGDYLQYSLWISSTSPSITGGVDMVCTDGYTLRDSPALDQHQISPHPKTNLQGYADDQWYTRKINVPSQMVGKTIGSVTVVQEGDATGTYVIYVKNVQYFNSGGTLLQTFYAGGTPNTNQQLGSAGYYNISVTPVVTYETTGTRTSPVYSVAAPVILKDSIITWNQVIPVQPASNATQGTAVAPIAFNVTWDGGATWLPVTNHAALPGMPLGMNLAGKSIQVQQVLSVAGPSPELTPQLSDMTVTIQPAYAATKTDAAQSTAAGGFGGGTLTNVNNASTGLQISGQYRDWDNGSIASQTLFGSDTVSIPAQSETARTLGLRVQGASDGRARMDWAGTWTNFVCEFDFQMPTNASANYGLEYRTTAWGNGMNSGAYRMDISFTGVQLNRGTNNGSASLQTNVVISTSATAFAPTVGNWYHVKVVVNGSSHTMYIDDVLYISATDATYSAGGMVALRYYNNQGSGIRTTTFFDSFGITSAAFVGTRVHPSVSLASVGTVGDSYIAWNATVPSSCTLLIEVSLNGGSTYTACTSGAEIPGLTPGVGVGSTSVLIRETLTTTSAALTPVLSGITFVVVGAYNASGTRVSPALALTNVGRVGSASVSWTANVPAGTTLGVDASLNGTSWTDISALNGLQLPSSFFYIQPAPFVDGFAVNDAGNYTSSFMIGGAAAAWVFDTANHRLTSTQTSGVNGVYQYTSITRADMYVEAALNYSDSGGLVARMVDASNAYYLKISDDQAATNPQTVQLFKDTGGGAQIGTTIAIAFKRGDYHVFRLDCQGTALKVYMDNVQLIGITDASVTGAGKAGIYAGANTNDKLQVYTFRVQAYGDTVTAVSLYTRVRLGSTLPTATPQVLQLTVAAHDPKIGIGATIPQTAYAYTKSVAQGLDDVATQSGTYVWYMDDSLNVYMHDRSARPAPYYAWGGVATGTGNILRDPAPTVTRPDMLYRNVQFVNGGVDVTSMIGPKQLLTDGITQQWTLNYPFAQAPVLTLNGVPLAVGASGATAGADIYWTLGSPLLVNDASETPPGPNDVLLITYIGQVEVNVEVDNTGGFPGTTTIAQMAAIENLNGGSSSGRVEDYISIPGLSKAAAIAKANALLQQYGILGTTLTFSTMQMGAMPGMLMGITLPQYGINNQLFLITGTTLVAYPTSTGGVTYKNTLVATTGPVLGDWTTLFSTILQGAVLAGV